MKKTLAIAAMGILAVTFPAQAAPGAAVLEEHYKAALNRVTQEVKQAPGAAEKREILNRFIDKMETGLKKAEGMESLSEQDKAALHAVAGKFYAYDAELNGGPGFTPVADADLDAFAGYIQQGMEQAPLGGGVYISGGALLVIIILLIVLL
jgi:hypothetical protein